jgi:apolipoprotein N-acyltransferase
LAWGENIGWIQFDPSPDSTFGVRTEWRPGEFFVRSDVNQDRAVDLSDAVWILNFLFLGRNIQCADAADVNDDGSGDIADAVYLLLFYWTAFEYLHLDWELSFPWLNLGNGFAMYPKLIQWYEFTGTLGGSFWIMLVNILLFKWIRRIVTLPGSRVPLIINGVVIVLLLAVPMLISLNLYNHYEEKGKTAEVIISQPNIDPWSEQYTLPASEVIRRTFDPVKPLLTQNTEFVVCPESAIQEDLWHHTINKSGSIRKIRQLMAGYPKLNVVIGASTFRLFGEDELIEGDWNSG